MSGDRVQRVAARLAKLRGCFEPGSAAVDAGFPCPFCRWEISPGPHGEADPESGCIAWAEALIAAADAP